MENIWDALEVYPRVGEDSTAHRNLPPTRLLQAKCCRRWLQLGHHHFRLGPGQHQIPHFPAQCC